MSPSPPRSRPRLAPPPARLSGRTPGLSALSAVVLTLVVALATPACGSSRPDQASVPVDTTPAAASTGATSPDAATGTGAPSSADQLAVNAILDRYWTIWLEASDPTNPEDPHLSEVLSAEALSQTRANLRSRAALGQAIVLPAAAQFRHHVEAIAFDAPGRATATECVVDDSQLIDGSTGAVINGSVATYELLKVLVQDNDGNWTISNSRQQMRWEGVAGCAGSA